SRSCTPGNSKRWWRLSQIPSGRRYLGQLEREFCEGGNFAADLDERAVCGELYTGAEHAKLVDFRLSLTKSDAQECRCPRRHDPLASTLTSITAVRARWSTSGAQIAPGQDRHPARATVCFQELRSAKLLVIARFGSYGLVTVA